MTITLTKSAEAALEATHGEKAGEDLADGEFIALVSVFGNVDRYGDVVMPGAFTTSLADVKASGDPLPVIWSHKWDDPDAYIGEVVWAEETDKGLRVKCRIDLDHDGSARIYRQLKARRIKQFSFAFDIRPGGAEWSSRKDLATGAEYEVFELRDLELIEVGPCLRGVNPETQLESVKAAHAAFTPPRTDTKSAEGDQGEQPTQETQDSDGHADTDTAREDGPETGPPASDDDGTASVELLEAELLILQEGHNHEDP